MPRSPKNENRSHFTGRVPRACSSPSPCRSSSAASSRSCARAGGGAARDVDRAARPRVLRARGRHGRLPGPRARGRARVLRAARRVRHRGARRGRRGALARRERGAEDSVTALVLVAALALGVLLSSDVFHSGRGRPTAVRQPAAHRPQDLALAAAASVAALARHSRSGRAGSPRLRRRGRARPGLRSPLPDAVLLALVALPPSPRCGSRARCSRPR